MRNQGDAQRAQETLAPVLERFSEGLETADVIDARKLLDSLN